MVELLKKALKSVLDGKVDIFKEKFDLTDYREKRAEYYKKTIENSLKELKESDLSNEEKKAVSGLYAKYAEKDIEGMIQSLSTLSAKKTAPKITMPRMPFEIRDEVMADYSEMQKCFEMGAYRSAVILCGRILETCLHRKYFDVTGRDILETQPGIGIGNLIAKLVEKNVAFEPGLTQQIHLINNVRIHSVHKKSEAFLPTKDQCQAIMLFTVDAIRKMF